MVHPFLELEDPTSLLSRAFEHLDSPRGTIENGKNARNIRFTEKFVSILKQE